ncbi:Reverse transcriptase domain [Trinorchestia longiramus]|nr:Reverse transcriptase domain [Trinorchestia longiramus]
MTKVEAHGIRGNYSRWIRNWLTGRTQRVVIHNKTSDSTLVTSGVPQGSSLGPLLFIIYINDFDVGIISKVNKFTDDKKLCHRAFTERDRATIQSDLSRLLQWTETWQMSFKIDKCSVMNVGANNHYFQHTMFDISIETVQQQRDLDVIVTENLKHDKQVEKSVENASRILGFIARNFEYKSKNIILPLYKALVRPHLKYAVQLWSPTLQKDINKMEKIQRKATKMIPELHNLSYERRLQRFQLISLEQRRLRGQILRPLSISTALTMSLWKGFSKETVTYDSEITAKNNYGETSRLLKL